MSKNINEKQDTFIDRRERERIGIVGLWYGKNYGSILTYYALYKLVEDLGYAPIMLSKPSSLWDGSFNNPKEIAQRFAKKHCNIAPRYSTMWDNRAANHLCSTFVVGSDVVWNYDICGRDAGHYFFLDFADSDKKKVAFASSLGAGLDDAPDSYVEAVGAYLRDFDFVSVRERPAVSQLADDFGVASQHVMDPVFLVDRMTYDAIADEVAPISTQPYLMSYLLGPDEEKADMFAYLTKKTGYAQALFKNPNLCVEDYNQLELDVIGRIGVSDWLRGIRECEFFLGDSFHGLCFSLVYHKPFACYVNRGVAGIQRFQSLLDDCGLSDRLVYSDDPWAKDKMNALVEKHIDWDDVDERIGAMAEPSVEWLATALASDERKSFWDRHAACI